MKEFIFTINTLLFSTLIFTVAGCESNKIDVNEPIKIEPEDSLGVEENAMLWLTTLNETSLIEKQEITIKDPAKFNPDAVINIDASKTFQEIDGFGYTLTGGSAMLINNMSDVAQAALLQELFGTGKDELGVSYLRISIGASDLSKEVFSYNDLPPGETDINLEKFSLSNDKLHLIPILKQILEIAPNIKIMGSPWSAPVWMKDNKSSIGGSLLKKFYPVYARYFVKYIKA
ncbi:MAG TPA: glucosylceramidase, partial [Salinimicrobium sp.]|nr:glucosylceramidase [Salinimicrobium sp.]